LDADDRSGGASTPLLIRANSSNFGASSVIILCNFILLSQSFCLLAPPHLLQNSNRSPVLPTNKSRAVASRHDPDQHSTSVAEIVNGEPKPFPNEEWNKLGPPASHFICVQSVVVDDQDNLWVLDPASPKMQGIVRGGPKLVKIDLQTNQVVGTIPFDEHVAPNKSYLNDVRVDTRAGIAFITDSGKGAIVVVDIKTGKARRLLDGHPSTQPK